jgi:hypothetical protein
MLFLCSGAYRVSASKLLFGRFLTVTVKSIEPVAVMNQAASHFLVASRVPHTGLPIMTTAVERRRVYTINMPPDTLAGLTATTILAWL